MGETANLPPKRRRFVEEYLIDSNGTQACVRAGYSPNSANVQAAQLLTIPSVQAAVKAGQARITKAAQVTQEDVVRGLRLEAERLNGNDPLQGAGPRVQAWQHLGRHLGMFDDKLRLAGDPESPVVFNLRLGDGLRREDPVTIEHEPAEPNKSRA